MDNNQVDKFLEDLKTKTTLDESFKAKYAVILTYHTVIQPCKNKHRCWICAVIECPSHNPAHFSKTSCPSCSPELLMEE